MSEHRIELCDFTQGMVPRLRTMGLFSEMIAWKLRMFVPTGDTGPEIFGQLTSRYPIVKIGATAPH